MKSLLLFFSAALIMACNNSPQPVVNTNSAASPERSERTETVTAHTTENQPPPGTAGANNGRTKWTQGGDPIDTKQLDAAIAGAEKNLKSKPNDDAAKKALAEAYYDRADALTKARQYASALGDYRRTLKYDPDNASAKEWVDQIVSIYDSMNREAPPEGQEPPPLPYKPEK